MERTSRAYAKRYKSNKYVAQLTTATPTLLFNANANRVGLIVTITPDATGAALDGIAIGGLIAGAVCGFLGASRDEPHARIMYDEIGADLCGDIYAVAAFATVFACTIIEVIDTGNE